MQWEGRRVEALTVHFSVNYYLSGFQLVDSSGDKSEILGAAGNAGNHAFATTVSVRNVRRITLDSNTGAVFSLAFKTDSDDENHVYMNSYGHTVSHLDLAENEVIVGLYGDKNDNSNYKLKRFGFIVSTLS